MITSPMLVAHFVAAFSLVSLLKTTLANPVPDPWMRKTIRGPHFNIEYQCDTNATEYCTDALKSIRLAAEKVGKALNMNMKAPINMFIEVLPQCAELTLLKTKEDRCAGYFNCLAYMSAEVPVHSIQDNLTYLYPSSLIRQLDIPGKDRLALPQFDIYWPVPANHFIVHDNALAFQIGDPKPQNFNHTAVRNIFAGLGFHFSTDGVEYDRNIKDNQLIWRGDFNKGPPTVTSDLNITLTSYAGFKPPTVWDQHVTLNGTRLVEFYKRFTECREAFSNTTQALEKDPCVNPIAKEYFQAAVVNVASIKFSDSDLEPIYIGDAARSIGFTSVPSIDPLAVSAMRVLGYGSHNSSNKDIFIEPSALDNQAIQLGSYVKFTDE